MTEPDTSRNEFSDYSSAIFLLMGVNLLLGGLKLTLGYAANSTALRSDGWNNAADFIYSLLLTAGLWVSTKPPDASHPEGHDRFQSIIGFLVALVILGTGVYVLYDAYLSFMNPRETVIGPLAVSVVLGSVVLKGGIGWFLLREGQRLRSPALRAIGWDQMADILADLAVLAALSATYFEVHLMDPIVACGIGLLILRVGWEPLTENLGYLTGRAPEEDLETEIVPLVESSNLFTDLTDLRLHHVGPTLHVLATVKAPGETPLSKIHAAEETLREDILKLTDVSRVFIHVEPPEADSPQ